MSVDKSIKADTNERKVNISELKHAIHCLNFDYHHRCFIAPRRCNPDASGMFYSTFINTTCSLSLGKVNLITPEQFKDWLQNTDANITYIGKRVDLDDLTKRDALDTMVTYCTDRIDTICGGSCSVFNGGSTCINA